MPRTTIDIDAPILRDLKRLQKQQKQPLGRIISDLLARALPSQGQPGAGATFQWKAKPMGKPRVDLLDKAALWAILEDRSR